MLLLRRPPKLLPGARGALLELARGIASSEGDPLATWEAKASKEAKGKDPYAAFGSVNHDVRAPPSWGVPSETQSSLHPHSLPLPPPGHPPEACVQPPRRRDPARPRRGVPGSPAIHPRSLRLHVRLAPPPSPPPPPLLPLLHHSHLTKPFHLSLIPPFFFPFFLFFQVYRSSLDDSAIRWILHRRRK